MRIVQHTKASALMDDINSEFPSIVDFPTAMVVTEVWPAMQGAAAITFFATDDRPPMRTVLGANTVIDIVTNLKLAVSSVPSLSSMLGLDIPLKRAPRREKASIYHQSNFFGQSYPTAIVLALGTLMIRVNLLEKSLIKLLGAVENIEYEEAHLHFYSTVNFNERIKNIKIRYDALLCPEDITALVQRATDEANSVSLRRNALVHGHWSFKRDKFEVETPSRNKDSRSTVQIVTLKSLENLMTDYRLAGVSAEMCARMINDWRSRSI